MTDLRFLDPAGLVNRAAFNERFEKLNNAAFLEKVPLYTKVEVDLANALEGDVIKLKEGGKAVEFYVAKHDYESGLNGSGRTLVVRKDCYDIRAWHSSNVNAYATCTLDTWFNGTYKALLDAEIQAAVGTTKFYYTPGNGNTTVSQLERAVFALSLTELGQSHTNANVEGTALSIAGTLKIAYLNGAATTQWTRSPYTNDTADAWSLYTNGGIYGGYCTSTGGVRPCFTLPSDFTMTYYEDADGNIHPEQKYSSNITDLFGDLMTIGTQIETGSYVGTGGINEENAVSIVFSFIPKIIGLATYYQINDTYGPDKRVNSSPAEIYDATSVSQDVWVQGFGRAKFGKISGNTFSMYDTTLGSNWNSAGYTYHYFAIG